MKFEYLTGRTNTPGDLTVISEKNIFGFIEKIEMVYADGDVAADVVFSVIDSGNAFPIFTKANLGTSDDVFYPRTSQNKISDGSNYSEDGSKVFLSGSLKFIITNGGASKTYRFYVYLSDE